MLLLPVMWRIFGILHFVAKFQQCIFYIVEPLRWWFAVAGGTDRRHGGKCFSLDGRNAGDR